jgi:hypothetical protein
VGKKIIWQLILKRKIPILGNKVWLDLDMRALAGFGEEILNNFVKDRFG